MQWRWLVLWLEMAVAALLGDADVEALGRATHSLIYFFSDSCQYCRQFDPTWHYLTEVIPSSPQLQLVEVDGPHNPKLAQLFSVSGWPTLKLLNYETKRITHIASRDLGALVALVAAETGVDADFSRYRSPVHKVAAPVDVTAPSANDSYLVVTAPWCDGWQNYHYPTHFIQTAAQSKHVLVADITEYWDILPQLNLSKWPVAFHFRDGKVQGFAPPDAVYLQQFLDNNVDLPWHSSIDDVELMADAGTGYGIHVDHGSVQSDDDDAAYDAAVTSIAL
ncbi:hypothetical protein DIURU_004766 [Diutina rugosa]|uniref:Thioredoxin domain-containing protein n=1 Tax=Diutina rugosa TaxID=5481 RepID=A0A642UF17_DIURU|nr:uncharacterized protein DIURU_004766 [Diutina rugosa]KAA8897913.1 hypothetical protein DIURU_004766 [Diutina rugosa]